MTRTTTQRTANRGSRARASQPNNGAARPTREQRVAMGKAARREVPRESHAEFAPTAARPDPVALLESQGSARVPELLPIRYGRMAASPFAFFRGAALSMAADLADHPAHRHHRAGVRRRPPGELRRVRLPGAAGSSSTSTTSTRRCPGRGSGTSSGWRRACEIAARASGFAAKRSPRSCWRGRARTARRCARSPSMGTWTSGTRTLDRGPIRRFGAELGKAGASGWSAPREGPQPKDNLGALGKLHGDRGRRPRIVRDPPLIVPLRDLVPEAEAPATSEQSLRRMLDVYRTTLSSRPTGACSSNTASSTWPARSSGWAASAPAPGSCCCSAATTNDPLFLQAKEAQAVGAGGVRRRQRVREPRRSAWSSGQRLMQAVSDIFLGWVRTRARRRSARLLLRQLRDWKGSADDRDDGAARDGGLRRAVRLDAGPGPRALRRPHRDRRLSRLGRRLRPGHRRVRRGLRRPERA